jgi:hypothetical protein
MKGTQWTVVFMLAAVISFYGGYSLSTNSGTEPGYFGAVEAAGYGGDGGGKIEGVSDEMSNYYQELLKEDE